MKKLPLKTRILYSPLTALLWVAGHLPLRVLYGFADLLSFLARDVVRYRRSLVARNIEMAFPEMPAEGRKRVARRFYRHLADYIVETIRFPYMQKEDLQKHIRFENTELIDSTLEGGRNIVIYTSHFGNWEWITCMGLWCRTADSAVFSHVYRPLRNKYFDRWFLKMRSRFNLSIPMHDVFRELLRMRQREQRFITGFLSDQKPSHNSRTFDVPFMGVKTPFIGGTEELATRLGACVMLFDTSIEGRGKYVVRIKPLAMEPRTLEPGKITAMYASMLEEQIRRSPYAYLWSHNRWRLPKKGGGKRK